MLYFTRLNIPKGSKLTKTKRKKRANMNVGGCNHLDFVRGSSNTNAKILRVRPRVNKEVRDRGVTLLTCILPSFSAGPSSASRRMYRPMLYSFPPLRLKPKPRWLRSSSTTKQPCCLQTKKDA